MIAWFSRAFRVLIPSDLLFGKLSIMSLVLLSCFSVWGTRNGPPFWVSRISVFVLLLSWCGMSRKGKEVPNGSSLKNPQILYINRIEAVVSTMSHCWRTERCRPFLASSSVLHFDSSASPAVSMEHLPHWGIKMQIDKREKESVSPEERTVCVSLSCWILEIQLVLSIRGVGRRHGRNVRRKIL